MPGIATKRSWLPIVVLRCIRENLFRLPERRDVDGQLGRPQFLACPGLFDYLPDDSAVALLALLWRQLADGGLMLVGNFAEHNPARAFMEWIGNWYLIYRTVEQMERLALGAGIPHGQFTIGSERLGVNRFLIARKDA